MLRYAYRLYNILLEQGDKELYNAIGNEDIPRIKHYIRNRCYAQHHVYMIVDMILGLQNVDTELIDFLQLHGFPMDRALSRAAKMGNIAIVTHILQTMNIPPTLESFYDASSNGNIDICKLLIAHGLDVSTLRIAQVVAQRQFEVVKWMHSIGIQPNENICVDSAYMDHSEIFKWAVEQGFSPWSDKVIENIARNGNLSLITWLYELDADCLLSYSPVIIKYTIDGRCPWKGENDEDRVMILKFLFSKVTADKQFG